MKFEYYIDNIAQDCSNSIANALETVQSLTKFSIYSELDFEWSWLVFCCCLLIVGLSHEIMDWNYLVLTQAFFSIVLA